MKSRLIIRLHDASLKPLSLTYPQALLILCLEERGVHFVDAIAKKLSLDTGTVTPLVKRLSQNGIVIKKRDSKDERRVSLMLSDYGRSLIENIQRVFIKTKGKINLSPEETAHLLALLKKINF